MTIYELIKQHKELLKVMHRHGVSTDHVRWLEVYDAYYALRKQGYKKTYCATKIAEQYGYRERWIRAIVSFMEEVV